MKKLKYNPFNEPGLVAWFCTLTLATLLLCAAWGGVPGF